ncbi:MAG: exo-alpha-sialidase [Clostridiales bacterium]|nr:exo-alpha-sialidase [Clostridiales bacterium]
MIRPYQTKAIPEKDTILPEVEGTFYGYGFKRDYFDYEKIESKYKHWYINRIKPGKSPIVEEVSIDLPDYTMNTSEGVFPTPYFHQIKKGPNNSLWTFLYKHYMKADGKISDYCASWFHKSTDNGKTWQYMSRVPYQFDIEKDPGADKRYGFGEPDMCFIDENRAFALHRTTDGTGIGPMYITWTTDGGRNWTKPEYFDERGVWPQTAKLDNGVILAGYGRPGLFIRPYYEGEWHDRIAVVEPMDYQTDTCSYCALIETGPDTVLVFYSDFNYPDKNGVPRKSIMVREITVEV